MKKVLDKTSRILAKAMKRVRILTARLDAEGAEMFSGLAALGVAGVLALPGDYLQSNPALVELARHAPESFYASVLALLGGFQIIACVLGGKPSELITSSLHRVIWLLVRQYGLRGAFGIWLGMAYLITIGHGYIGTVFYALAAGACVRASYRVNILIIRARETENMLSMRDGVIRAERAELSALSAP